MAATSLENRSKWIFQPMWSLNLTDDLKNDRTPLYPLFQAMMLILKILSHLWQFQVQIFLIQLLPMYNFHRTTILSEAPLHAIDLYIHLHVIYDSKHDCISLVLTILIVYYGPYTVYIWPLMSVNSLMANVVMYNFILSYLYHFNLWASFPSHLWIQTGVTVQKCS